MEDWGLITKLILLIAFTSYIPVSAWFYFSSRHEQRVHEVNRYLEILNIEDRELFEHVNPAKSLAAAVAIVTLLVICGWIILLFGTELNLSGLNTYLFAASSLLGDDKALQAQYQKGAILTFSMSFLGAYLWTIQSIARRYTMNDLIPAGYYNAGIRIVFACMLALVLYHLSDAVPHIFNISGNDKNNQTQLMPIFAFLIGMFPQRGLRWLTEKFSMFSSKTDTSVHELPLDMIEGIYIYDRVRLQELGIDSCYDLANADFVPYLFKSPYSPRELINWILQAKLCVYFGENIKELRKHGIHTVWQLKDYDEHNLKELSKSTSLTEDTLIYVKCMVENDDEIKRLIAAQKELSQYWIRNMNENAPDKHQEMAQPETHTTSAYT